MLTRHELINGTTALITNVTPRPFLLHEAGKEIKDNGKGFDPNQHIGSNEKGSGLGLKNLKTRAEELGGYMKIHSSSGMGTTIMMSFPVEERV